MPLYRILHQTTYRHAAAAAMSWQFARLHPRDEPGQETLAFEMDVKPGAGDVFARKDYFGNTCHAFSVRGPINELHVDTRSLVRREEPVLPMAGLTPAARDLPALADAAIAAGEFTLEQYRQASPAIPLLPEAARLAAGLPANVTLLDWIRLLGEEFSRLFAFDPQATTVATPLAEALRLRRGVCQDFSHAMISCARSHGLPAAYVSGYLLTETLPGQTRLRGADAMHAWVSFWVPETGWVDYDPTNRCFVGDKHVVVARGRDYHDVSPLTGQFRGGSNHTLLLGVTMEFAEEPSEA